MPTFIISVFKVEYQVVLVSLISNCFSNIISHANKWMWKKIPTCSNSALGQKVAFFLDDMKTSVSRFIEFLLQGGQNQLTFWPKLKLLYFVNKHNSRSYKCAKIRHFQTIFYDKKHLKFSKIDFYLLTFFDNSNFQTFYFLKLCPIFVDSVFSLGIQEIQ